MTTTNIKDDEDGIDDIQVDGNVDVIYLDHAGQARLSKKVQDAGVKALHRPPWQMVASAEEQQDVRRLFAHLIHAADADDDDDDDDDNNNSSIAIMPSTAFAMTLAAHNIYRTMSSQDSNSNSNTTTAETGNKNKNINKIHSKKKVLLLQDQHPSAVYPWQEICDYSQKLQEHYHHDKMKNNDNTVWSIHVVPYPEEDDDTYNNNGNDGKAQNRTWTNSILHHLKSDRNHRIQVVVLPPLHWADGRLIDLVKIANFCRQKQQEHHHIMNIPFLIVDATQAAGILDINVQQIQPALLACSAHKWLRGPSGISLVYIDKKYHDIWEPLDQHERGRDFSGGPGRGNEDAAAAMRHFMDPITGYYPSTFCKDARKFDAGGKANPILLPMLRASLRQVVVHVDPKKAQLQLKSLMQPLLDWAQNHGFVVPPEPHAWHLIGIRPPPPAAAMRQVIPKQQQRQLQEQLLTNICHYLATKRHIIVQARCGVLRISPHIHDTTPHQIQGLIQALDEFFLGSHATADILQDRGPDTDDWVVVGGGGGCGEE